MSIRLAVSHVAAGVFAACLSLAATGEAMAQANVLKECGGKYQAAKAASELKGQTWQDFLKKCREDLATEPAKTEAAPEAPKTEPVKAEPPKTEPVKAEPPKAETPATEPAKTEAAKPAADAKTAAKDRQKQCGAEWKAKKAELKKKDPKITWPKFWSECSKRLKGE
jgi:hypothetical protein